MTINSEQSSPNSITFSAGKEVMRITSRGITVAPDVHVEEAAKVVIEALEKHILNLVATARADALEEAAMRCDMEANSELYPAPGGFTDPREEAHKKTARRIAAAIRALKEGK